MNRGFRFLSICVLLSLLLPVLPSNAVEPEEETSLFFVEWSATVEEIRDRSGENYLTGAGGEYDPEDGWWSWDEVTSFFLAFDGYFLLEAHWVTLEGKSSIAYWTISDFQIYELYEIEVRAIWTNIGESPDDLDGTGETVEAHGLAVCQISENGMKTISDSILFQPFVIGVSYLDEFFLEGLNIESVYHVTGTDPLGQVIDTTFIDWFPTDGAPRTLPFDEMTQTFLTESDQPFPCPVTDARGVPLWHDLTVHWRVEVTPEIPTNPPKIEEIIVTGFPDEKNPMTECPSTLIFEEVQFEAKITPAWGFEVTKVSWTGDDLTPGEENPYETWYAPGTHGKKRVVCTIFYRNIFTGETGKDVKTKTFKLFFVKAGDDDLDRDPNWYEYWGQIEPSLASSRSYSSAWTGIFDSAKAAALWTFDNATGTGTDDHITIYRVMSRNVMYCCSKMAHENKHHDDFFFVVWGGPYDPAQDGDHDALRDAWETANGFNATVDDWTDFRDNWFEPRGYDVENNYPDVSKRDWAHPGAQSCMHACSDSGYTKAVEPTAEFTGNYSDYGRDTNGDGLYDYLTIEVEVNVTGAREYHVTSVLHDRDGNEIIWADNTTNLSIGVQSLKLSFDGQTIYEHGVDGPYNLRNLGLWDDENWIIEDYVFDAYNTSEYDYAEFQRPTAEFTGNYSDYGRDTNGDGLYDYLTIETEVNVEKGGTYTTIGYLYDGNGNSITSTMESPYLDVGRQLVELNFDGLSINRHRVDGPYNLRYLSVRGSDQVDFILDAYNTSAYSYADFEKTDAGFTGSYSDYGKDTDGDGLYNYLTVEVEIDVSTSGNYALVGWLYDNTGAEIVIASSSANLDAGSQTMPLDFDGASIHNHGVDGPYELKYITLYDENGALMDTLNYAYTTATYNYAQFHAYMHAWIEGTVTDADTRLPIEGATVSADGCSNFTDSSGFYSIEVPPGTYDVTAEMMGYESQTVPGVEVAADETVTQDFALSPPPVQYQLTIDVVGSGTTNPAPGDHMYDEGTDVDVNAIPDAGWKLDHWLLDGVDVGDADPFTVTMDADHTLTAVFVEIHMHDVAVIYVSPLKTEVYRGEIVDVSVDVENEGDFTETFEVITYYDTIIIETKTVTDLAPYTSITLTFHWDTTGVPYGSYVISARASDLPGETDIDDNFLTDGTVRVIGMPPGASFTYEPSTPYVGEAVTFDASASYDPDGIIVSYDWDFGDGTTGSGVTVTHTYAAEGNYAVTLIVTDNDGLTATVADVVTVLPAPITKAERTQHARASIIKLKTSLCDVSSYVKPSLLMKLDKAISKIDMALGYMEMEITICDLYLRMAKEAMYEFVTIVRSSMFFTAIPRPLGEELISQALEITHLIQLAIETPL